MKCKFCGSEKTKDVSVGYIGDDHLLERYSTAVCKECKRTFSYISKMEIPKAISSKYTLPK